MGDLTANRSALFFDYLDSLGFICTNSYQHLRQKLIQVDEKRLLIEVSNYFQGVSVSDWFELTSQVYSTWSSKINRQYQNDLSFQLHDMKQGQNSALQSTLARKSRAKDLSASAILNTSAIKDSKNLNGSNENFYQKRQSTYSNSSEKILVEDMLMNNRINVSPAKPSLNTPKLKFLASLFDNLVSKRLLHAFYNIQYAAIESNRNPKVTQNISVQPTKPTASTLHSHSSSGREGTFERSLKVQYQLLEQIKKKKSVDVSKKALQKINKTMLLSKNPQPKRTIFDKSRDNKSRRSDSMGFVAQNNTIHHTRQVSPESVKVEGNSRTQTPDAKYKESKKLNFHLYGQRKESDGLGINWQGVKEYAELAQSQYRSNTYGNQPIQGRNEEDQFYTQFAGVKNGTKADHNSPYKFDDDLVIPKKKSLNSELNRSINLDSSANHSMPKRSPSPISLNTSYEKSAGSETFNRLYRDADKKANNLRILEQKIKIERGETFSPNLTKTFKPR